MNAASRGINPPRGRPEYPAAWEEKEAALVYDSRRRRDPGSDRSVAGVGAPLRGSFGVALSGGGIRSATFCLGVFRALARISLVRRIDFLSTVSGGGYFGAFLGGLYARKTCPMCDDGAEDAALSGGGQARRSSTGDGAGSSGSGPAGCERADCVERILQDLQSKPVEFLRDNGRYLSPNGAGDTLMAGAVLLRNWLALMVVLSALCGTAFALAALAARLVGDVYWARLHAVDAAMTSAVGSSLLLRDPALMLPVLMLLGAVAPLALAYWLTPLLTRSGRWRVLPAIVIPSLAFWYWRDAFAPWPAVAAAWAGLSLAYWFIAVGLAGRHVGAVGSLTRNHLSRGLSAALWTAAGFGVFALFSRAGRALADVANEGGLWGSVPAVLASASALLTAGFGFAQKLAPILSKMGTAGRLSVKPQTLVWMAAAVAGSVYLLTVATIASLPDLRTQWAVCIAGLLLAVSLGFARPFLNLSSHSTLYSQRITRAYLGASNRARLSSGRPISETLESDILRFAEYRPHERGGPLHLINVTLNETVSGRSQLEQRDRKGLPLSVGPCGVSVGRNDHAEWTPTPAAGRGGAGADEIEKDRDPRLISEKPAGFAVFPDGHALGRCEPLTVGDWTAISGAAFTTGIGSRTSLAASLLLGLFNIRLGHWWDSGVPPQARKSFQPGSAARRRIAGWLTWAHPVYFHLLAELLARFPGTASRWWYLSDGGHFENTGAYELIRRRVEFILVCDAGCDPHYAFEDVANLVRKARTDFNAEVVFYDRRQLDVLLPKSIRPFFGTQDDIRRLRIPSGSSANASTEPCPHALLAAVFYDDPARRKRRPDSVMVVLKPVFSGDEPPDVVDYRRSHERFPQEPTTDQYFDEAQWESYRRLGEHVASRVFGFPADDDDTGFWRPISLERPPAVLFPGTPRGTRHWQADGWPEGLPLRRCPYAGIAAAGPGPSLFPSPFRPACLQGGAYEHDPWPRRPV